MRRGTFSSRTTRPGECARSTRKGSSRPWQARALRASAATAGRPVQARVEPFDVAADSGANLYITDYTRVRKVTADGIINTIAAAGPETAARRTKRAEHVADVTWTQVAACTSPRQGTPRAQRHTGWQDSHGRRNGDCGYAGMRSLRPTPSQQTERRGSGPGGNMYIADTDNHRVRKVDRSGLISTFAGTAFPAYAAMVVPRARPGSGRRAAWP